jgi:hypothetical protein
MLKIPQGAALPGSLGNLYDQWFSGRKYRTRFDPVFQPRWIFRSRGELEDDIYFDCLERYTAQFNFGLDATFRVCVQCTNWIPIASSFVALVETDAVLEQSRARKDHVRGLGRFPSQDDFLVRHADYLQGFQDISADPEFDRILLGPKSLVVSSRFYTDEPTFTAVEYSF